MPITKRAGESIAAGGDNSPFNFELTCANCKTYLGPLGRFEEKVSKGEQNLPPAGTRFRMCHCPICHQNCLVTGYGEERWYPPVIIMKRCATPGCPNPTGSKTEVDLQAEIASAIEETRRRAS